MPKIIDSSRFVVARVYDLSTGQPAERESFVILERYNSCDGPRTRVSCEVGETFEAVMRRIEEMV